MKFNSRIFIVVTLAVLVLALVSVFQNRRGAIDTAGAAGQGGAAATESTATAATVDQVHGTVPETAGVPAAPRTVTRAAQRPRSAAGRSGGAAPATISEARLQALEKWEEFVDKRSQLERAVTEAESFQFKERLESLHVEDRLDAVQTALLLVPEEQFALFYPILFDTTVDEEILDEIFSDVLNQEDEIKMPILLAIYANLEHPMREEAERILEAIGALDEEDGEADE